MINDVVGVCARVIEVHGCVYKRVDLCAIAQRVLIIM